MLRQFSFIKSSYYYPHMHIHYIIIIVLVSSGTFLSPDLTQGRNKSNSCFASPQQYNYKTRCRRFTEDDALQFNTTFIGNIPTAACVVAKFPDTFPDLCLGCKGGRRCKGLMFEQLNYSFFLKFRIWHLFHMLIVKCRSITRRRIRQLWPLITK